LAEQFQARFTGLDVSVLLSSLFELRFATCDHMSESEKATTFHLAAQEIKSICFVWWKERKDRFPKVALAARKWLSVCSTSTPSERVFSICGVVDTA
jgi:hAT family C-terminal dimerisation region